MCSEYRPPLDAECYYPFIVVVEVDELGPDPDLAPDGADQLDAGLGELSEVRESSEHLR